MNYVNPEMTVIIPAYNEKGNIKRISDRLNQLLENEFSFEILFIDDGSRDSTWEEIVEMSRTYSFIRALKFSRNFGKEAAIHAGLSNARGQCAVVIDSDLQHPPEKIIEMYKMWKQGYHVVECVKSSRGKEKRMHSAAANSFYAIMTKLMKIDMANASDFKLLDRKAIDALLSMPEKNMFFRALSSWIGFKTCKIEFEVQEREEGESKWSTTALVKYALNNISLFSGSPLQIITFFGVLCFIACAVFTGLSIYNACVGLDAQLFVILAVQLVLSGIIMCGMGIMGYYFSKMFDEIKGRPRYLIEEECSNNEHNKETD